MILTVVTIVVLSGLELLENLDTETNSDFINKIADIVATCASLKINLLQ